MVLLPHGTASNTSIIQNLIYYSWPLARCMYKILTHYTSVSYFSDWYQLKWFCRLLKNQCFYLMCCLAFCPPFLLFVVYTESACLFNKNGIGFLSGGSTLVWVLGTELRVLWLLGKCSVLSYTHSWECFHIYFKHPIVIIWILLCLWISQESC